MVVEVLRMTRKQKRFGVLLALCFAAIPLWSGRAGWAGDAKPGDSKDTYQGKVVPLADILARAGMKLDADASSSWLVLQAEDGRIYPLVKDDGSRMFFKDAKLLNRPMRLTARRLPNSDLLHVVNVHSLVKGKLHDIYYWCDICTIKRFEAGICDCCGAPMEFREVLCKDP
jgi:hypothetical protein